MSLTLTEVKQMSYDELVEHHDKHVQQKAENETMWIRHELSHRDILSLTNTMKNLTWVILGLTLLNVGIVAF